MLGSFAALVLLSGCAFGHVHRDHLEGIVFLRGSLRTCTVTTDDAALRLCHVQPVENCLSIEVPSATTQSERWWEILITTLGGIFLAHPFW